MKKSSLDKSKRRATIATKKWSLKEKKLPRKYISVYTPVFFFFF